MNTNTDTRLYAAAIAVVSGLYSTVAAFGDGMAAMPMSDSIMLIVGVVVLLHGIVLLTPAAERLGRASGPLMLLWAAIMLGNQALAVASDESMMGAMSPDAGMVAIAVLMLASGLIMSRRRGQM